jgi:hypothetical protein
VRLEGDGVSLTCGHCGTPVLEVATDLSPVLPPGRVMLRALYGWTSHRIGEVTVWRCTDARTAKGRQPRRPEWSGPVLPDNRRTSRRPERSVADFPAVVVCRKCGTPNRIDDVKLGAMGREDFARPGFTHTER